MTTFSPASVPKTEPVWFDYVLKVHPSHTDYAGVVWHGSYLIWLEAARIEALAAVGIAFNDLVDLDCDLPVVGMQLRYHRAVKMGETVVVRSRIVKIDKIRIYWEQKVCSMAWAAQSEQLPLTEGCFLSAMVELVPVNRAIGRVLRQFPPLLATALAKLQTH
jgi:acyl-CoA thioester hydrolase